MIKIINICIDRIVVLDDILTKFISFVLIQSNFTIALWKANP